MRQLLFLLLLLWLGACGDTSEQISREEKRVLLVSNVDAIQTTTGHRILEQLAALSQESNFRLDTALHYSPLMEDTLKQYSALFFLNIFEDSLQIFHHADVERYVQAGGGIISLDTAVVTPYAWPWYEQLMNPDTLYKGKELFRSFDYDGGRAVSLDLRQLSGVEDLKEELKKAIDFAIGNNKSNYALAKSIEAPRWNRFTKVVLDDDIYEPMEMVILPDRKVLFLERRGKMKLYDPAIKRTKVIAEFDVCIDGNYEDGLHGLALDPNYGKGNYWIYMYYSPSSACDIPDQYLSRFEFKNDSLNKASEIVMLKVGVQRETCCHSGGAVEFGPDGLLYLSTGDNTSSKESDGYTPIDERPGRAPFDAQKSSANTNDLRGKIIRIKPEPDGTYSIPDGNLFPKDGSKGRPEIYAMGCRNPFRITIDKKTNWLYWGDVGPDVGQDGRYGPQSYDEWNQAKQAGNFGWPYFAGPNYAYPDRNFETDEVGKPFDPQHPINDSPNNTGARELPPAQSAWIWYPYGESKEFPLLGTGSRSAMAGPFYYMDDKWPVSSVKFPAYYEGKFFIFEWARSWIKVLTLDETGKLVKMESFMPDGDWSKPIDVKFGPDGALYVLEYGNQYFMNNPDARLSRIEFANGNRPPVPQLAADKPNGSAPHKVTFTAAGSFDYDLGDELTYEWFFTDEKQVQATGKEAEFTFTKQGIFRPKVKVTDSNGASSVAEMTIQIGNAPPTVELAYQGNNSFYFENMPTAYTVNIRDLEDEKNGGIDPNRAFVSLSYVEDPDYLNNVLQGKQELPTGSLAFVAGAQLIKESDCLSCHDEQKENIGPSYIAVAQRYKGDYKAVPELATKIIQGGNGNWGEKIMSGHPQLSEAHAQEMVKYILSLADSDRLPLQGKFNLNQHPSDARAQGGYLISAAYKDKGANGIEELTTRTVRVLRNPKVEAESADLLYNGNQNRFGQNQEFTQVNLSTYGYLSFKNIDLTGVKSLTFRLKHRMGGTVSVHLGNPEGERIAVLKLPESGSEEWTEVSAAVQATNKSEDVYIVFEVPGQQNSRWSVYSVDWIWFRN